VIEVINTTSLCILALSALLVLVRTWRGPTVFDRVLAIDTLTLVVVATLLVHHELHIDAAFGLALFAFVTTVLFGYFLGKGEFPHE
jgi:multisubunit Na+/H+ antiporter MnhF subunit